eukprot:129457-Chlamydomonas_euryale.AAC.2
MPIESRPRALGQCTCVGCARTVNTSHWILTCEVQDVDVQPSARRGGNCKCCATLSSVRPGSRGMLSPCSGLDKQCCLQRLCLGGRRLQAIAPAKPVQE